MILKMSSAFKLNGKKIFQVRLLNINYIVQSPFSVEKKKRKKKRPFVYNTLSLIVK